MLLMQKGGSVWGNYVSERHQRVEKVIIVRHVSVLISPNVRNCIKLSNYHNQAVALSQNFYELRETTAKTVYESDLRLSFHETFQLHSVQYICYVPSHKFETSSGVIK